MFFSKCTQFPGHPPKFNSLTTHFFIIFDSFFYQVSETLFFSFTKWNKILQESGLRKPTPKSLHGSSIFGGTRWRSDHPPFSRSSTVSHRQHASSPWNKWLVSGSALLCEEETDSYERGLSPRSHVRTLRSDWHMTFK